jgi:FdhD protein
MNHSSHQMLSMTKVANERAGRENDYVAREEPMEIELAGQAQDGSAVSRTVAITMCTPGHARDMAVGFLLGEAIVRTLDDVKSVYSQGPSDENGIQHAVRIVLRPDVRVEWDRLQRHFYTTSSCGVCGKTSLRALELTGFDPVPDPARPFDRALVSALPERLRAAQELFELTGGVHGAAIFDWDGHVRTVREDVGRHNAVDKVIGAEFLNRRWPLRDHVLVVSGRASFELVQKAIAAQIPLLVAVGAPSSLAVDAATEFGLTVIGFTKASGYNIYTHPDRIAAGRAAESLREVPA